MMWVEKQYDGGDNRKYKTWQIDIWLNVFSGVEDDITKSLWPKKSFEIMGCYDMMTLCWYDMMKIVAVNTRLD